MKNDMTPLGKSRSSAVRIFKALKCSLRGRSQLKEFADVVHEYFDMEHAELVPVADLSKPCNEVYYLPMLAVCKETSFTSKMRVMFDISAKTAFGTLSNDHLLTGLTVHPTIIYVLLCFQRHWVALTTDISRMYRAVFLPEHQRDLHRFMWRKPSTAPQML